MRCPQKDNIIYIYIGTHIYDIMGHVYGRGITDGGRVRVRGSRMYNNII